MSADPSAWRKTQEAIKPGSVADAGFLWQCSDCRKGRRITIRVGAEIICGECWVKRGKPEITVAALEEAHLANLPSEREAETRKRMLARGGADRHRARSGRS